MKKFKGMKKTIIILFIILLSIISFAGIYVKNKNQIENIMPQYLLAKDLQGYRRVELKVSETENATEENYQKSKEILEERINALQNKSYITRLNTENGNIIFELPEDSKTDSIISQLSLQGKFEITDNDTDEVLITNDDIKNVQAGYGSTNSGTTAVFININFNEAGTEKFKNITNTYVETTVEDETNEETTETKKIAVKIDDMTLLTTYFDEEVTNGVLQLSVGSSSTSTTAELQEYLEEANSIATLLNSGKLPNAYEVEQNKLIYSDITTENLQIISIITVVVLALAMLYLIFKYKTKAILTNIAQVRIYSTITYSVKNI